MATSSSPFHERDPSAAASRRGRGPPQQSLAPQRGGSDILSPRSSVSSHGSFMSPASTPDIDGARMRRDKLVKQASIKWERDVIKSSLIANVSPSEAPKRPDEHSRLKGASPKAAAAKLGEAGWSSPFCQRRKEAKATTPSFVRPPCLQGQDPERGEQGGAEREPLRHVAPRGKRGTILGKHPLSLIFNTVFNFKTRSFNKEIVDEAETDCIEEADENCFTLSDFRSDSQNGEESLKEWYIPFGDIEFRKEFGTDEKGTSTRAGGTGGADLHHPAELQPGAQPVHGRGGPDGDDTAREHRPLHGRLHRAAQAGRHHQGMGYLHAKGIVHQKLNSKNIILECRVKVCIMDHGMADQQLDRGDYGCIPRGHLSYISPELMSSLQIDPPRIYTTEPCTQESDLFAFGSLLYELLAERFALHDQPPHAIIWQITAGKTAALHNFRFVNGLKTLIKRCWSVRPEQRPPFCEIGHILQENVSHHRRHSCSEPDLLHHAGQASGRILCA
ncbi:kinase suppressor of Ras 2 [Caerostris extrusa]|uniref:Kinase suppressor of Ras 2 n=1 Tax=Caerostris extrusa TaxID=172846 RepID=A0AAV4MI04_CAEEX|nr:kinase suppressor of Ras 2 [Caerostris extrusa]